MRRLEYERKSHHMTTGGSTEHDHAMDVAKPPSLDDSIYKGPSNPFVGCK